jgi:hypothetical protein
LSCAADAEVTTVKSNGGKQLCCQSHPAPTTYQGVPVLQCGLHNCHLLLGAQGGQRKRNLQTAEVFPLSTTQDVPLGCDQRQPGVLQVHLCPGVGAQRAVLQQVLSILHQPGVRHLGLLLAHKAQQLLRHLLRHQPHLRRGVAGFLKIHL